MSALPVPSDAGGVDPQASRFVRIAAVRQMTGLRPINNLSACGCLPFPPPVQLSSRAVDGGYRTWNSGAVHANQLHTRAGMIGTRPPRHPGIVSVSPSRETYVQGCRLPI